MENTTSTLTPIPVQKKRRRWPLVVLINLLVIALLLEIGLRVVVGRSVPPRFFEPHDTFGHFHVAGRSGYQRTGEYESYVEINDKGLRDDEVPYEKPAGVRRILILGDSFAEGLQVEGDETFPAVLEQLFVAAGEQVEVIDAGVSRYGTDNDLLYLENEGVRYQPDVVIYAFYPNDVTDVVENDIFHLTDSGELEQQPFGNRTWERIRGRFYDWSYIYRIGLAIYLQAAQANDETLIDTDWGLILPIYRPAASLKSREIGAWALVGALLEKMQAVATEAGAEFWVVALPENFQAEDDLWAEVDTADEPLDRTAPNTQLASRMPANTTFLDLLPAFQAQAHTTNLYYESDGHFHVAGHQLAAEQIFAALAGETDADEIQKFGG